MSQAPAALLIVDDNEALSQLLAWEFEDLGYRVCRAADCRQAVFAATATAFDFALIDYHLPDGDGSSLSRRLRQILPQARMVSMSADRGGATAGDTAPVSIAFVEKPVSLARIHHLFGGQRSTPRAAG